MIVCDMCAEPRTCLQKEIDGKVFDICERCWRLLLQKLQGKRRIKACDEELEEFVETTV